MENKKCSKPPTSISLKNQPHADDSPNHRSIVDRLRFLEFSHRQSTSLAPFNPPLPRADTITWQRLLSRTPLGQGISCDMNPTIHFWPVIENGLWLMDAYGVRSTYDFCWFLTQDGQGMTNGRRGRNLENTWTNC
jgi:hypothetical protein